MYNLAVFFGGRSTENEISVLTGIFVQNVIDKEKFNVIPVYIGLDGKFYSGDDLSKLDTFKKSNTGMKEITFLSGNMYFIKPKTCKLYGKKIIDVAINCCHGGLGEGGGVSAIMQMNGIPFASPDLGASAICMDKEWTKLFALSLNVPTLDFIKILETDYVKRGAFLIKHVDKKFDFPVVVKPSGLGSSIGIKVVKDKDELKKAIEYAFTLDKKVIVEKYLERKFDVNCAAYLLDGNIVVSETEIASEKQGIYGFSDKYLSKQKTERRTLPSPISESIKSYTRVLYKRLNMKGLVRMDYLVSGDKIYLSEINSVPGSLAYYLFSERITEARTMFTSVIEDTLKNGKQNVKKVISTGILSSVNIGGKVRGVRL